jgi:hypothetical protein
LETSGRCERQDGAGIVQVFVDELVVHAHAMAQARLLRHQRWIRKHIIDVVEDQRRLNDRLAVVNERRHDPVRIAREIGRLVLVAAQSQQMFFGLQARLRQRDSHLPCANRINVVVEL